MLVLTNAVGIVLFLYLIKLSLVLVPNAQLQTSAGLGLSARLGLRWPYRSARPSSSCPCCATILVP